jgi:hypothetical protein
MTIKASGATKKHFEDIFIAWENDMMPLIALICFHFPFQCFIFSKRSFHTGGYLSALHSRLIENGQMGISKG